MKALGLSCLLMLAVMVARAENWPGWRGPRGDGTSSEKAMPTHWSGTENVVWKTAVPGEGSSSPIIWGERIFLTSALKGSPERVLLSFDRKTGKIHWQQTVLKAPLESKHKENGYASATPVTDGKQVYVAFLDRTDVAAAAYDFAGEQIWLTRPGTFKNLHGFSHSPVLFEDMVILACYSKEGNFVAAVSQADGQTVWKIPAPNPSQSFSAPLLREMAGRMQLVVPGNNAVTSYDPRTGKVLWVVDGPASDFVATPVYNAQAGLLLASSSWPKKMLIAIKPDGQGNVTSNKVVWTTTEGVPYVPSPIALGDWFFTSSFVQPSAYCYEATTGKVLWSTPVGLHHASPVTANGLLYFLNDDGVTHVMRAGPTLELVAKNELGEKTYASPALSEGQIFLRSFNHLYCIGQSAK